MLITWLFVPQSDQTKNLKSTYTHRKNSANESPLRDKFVGKIQNFYGFGAAFPHFCHYKREIQLGGADIRSAPCQISRLSEQCVAPAGRKTHFWTT